MKIINSFHFRPGSEATTSEVNRSTKAALERTKAVIVVVFRSRLRPEARDDYLVWAKRMAATVATIPGYLSHKAFVAEDGERLTHVTFEDETALKAWAVHPDHRDAKKLGRSTFFSEYSFQICRLIRDRKPDLAGAGTETPDPAGEIQP